jgi:hypothetical protein
VSNAERDHASWLHHQPRRQCDDCHQHCRESSGQGEGLEATWAQHFGVYLDCLCVLSLSLSLSRFCIVFSVFVFPAASDFIAFFFTLLPFFGSNIYFKENLF